MKSYVAKMISFSLNGIARYFIRAASPIAHRPEIPQELKK
jgi:cyclic lactone autoinducer peptide